MRTSTARGFLLLARASNLPTVWSNCVAGWILGGSAGLPPWGLLLLCAGASLLYTGGMFLNDAFDAEFDRRYRPERPIPSGMVSASTVWWSGSLMLLAGSAALAWFGPQTAGFTLALVLLILAYDAVHKKTMLSPILMGACRFLLYLVAASVAGSVDGFTVWSALVLALYIVGLSYIAKAESAPGPLRYWPMLFLASPLVLAWIVNDYNHRLGGFILGTIFITSTAWSLRHVFRREQKNIGATISGLLAGIVWVDLLAVGNLSFPNILLFAGLFLAARLFQRFVPAT